MIRSGEMRRSIRRLRDRLGSGRLLALLATLLLLLLRLDDPLVLEILRARSFDLLQMASPRPVPADPPVVIVDIDEASLARLGQWPWPRLVLAALLDRLSDAGAAIVAFDMVFAEADRTSPEQLARTLAGQSPEAAQRLAGLPSFDQRLADSITKLPVVLGMSGQSGRLTTGGTTAKTAPALSAAPASPRPLPAATPAWAEKGSDPRHWLTRPGSHFPAMLRNIPLLDDAATGWGSFTIIPETDGVVRRVPALLTDGERLYPSLALEVLRVAFGGESFLIDTDPGLGIRAIRAGRQRIETDPWGRLWIHARRHDPALYLSAEDILSGSFDPARVQGRIVLIGTSAVGLGDIRTLATEPRIPGVEVNAQIIETILDGQQLRHPAQAELTELAGALTGALLLIILCPWIGARWTLLLFAAVAALELALSRAAYLSDNLLIDPVFPLATALLAFIITLYGSHARTEAQRRQVRAAFSRYLNPALVEKLAQDPTLLQLGGETRTMTLLFCDVRGFTGISELYDAQGLTRLINRFLTPMTDTILARSGTIDKYMGDCIMAFWNAPLDDPDHAVHACTAALEMPRVLDALNATLQAEAAAENRPFLPIRIGIGLNSGPAVVGNMGSTQRFDYSVLGDTVNLASRLEGQSKTYGMTTVIGEKTQMLAPDFATLELDLIKVKGKTEAVRIFGLLGEPALRLSPAFQQLAALHQQMLTAYRGCSWDRAEQLLDACRSAGADWHLDHLYEMYAGRMAHYRLTPPPQPWDGVYTATSK